jgi:hypothetical protein
MHMNHELHITVDREAPVRIVKAEIDLDEAALRLHPDSIEGILLGLSVDELLRLKFDGSAVVGVHAKRYKFTRLEKDGAFTLRRD